MTIDVSTQQIPAAQPAQPDELAESGKSEKFLTPEQEKSLVSQLNDIWVWGKEARGKALRRKKRLAKAYRCEHEEIILKRTGSKAYLPWTYTAHESAQARLSNSLLPNDEDVFDFVGETEDEQQGCDMMAEYIKASLKRMDFENKFDDAIKDLLFGEVFLSARWKVEKQSFTTSETVTVANELGNPVEQTLPVQQEVKSYNGIYCEPISSEHAIVYPVTGDLCRATIAYEVFRFKDELLEVQEQGVYENVDSIPDTLERSGLATTATDKKNQPEGLSVKEYWISRIKLPDAPAFRNYVATVVEDKYLIRFEPNTNDYGLKQLIYAPLIKDYEEKGLTNTGHGLTDRAFEIQKMANFIINQVFDESKIKLFGYTKYTEDGVFNPATFVARAGGLVKVGDINNLQPVNPNIGQLSFGINEVQYLENQYETVTGVPKFLKGIADDQPGKDTATAKRLAADGADTRFRAIARRINAYVLKPLIMLFYALIRQYALTDPDVMMDIARTTQQGMVDATDPMTGQVVGQRPKTDEEMLASMPQIPPLHKVDVNIVGFENVLDKADRANQLERFVSGVANLAQYDPSVMTRLKIDRMIDHYARNLSIDSDVVRTEQEVIQEQARQMQVQANHQADIINMAQRLGVDPNMALQAMGKVA